MSRLGVGFECVFLGWPPEKKNKKRFSCPVGFPLKLQITGHPQQKTSQVAGRGRKAEPTETPIPAFDGLGAGALDSKGPVSLEISVWEPPTNLQQRNRLSGIRHPFFGAPRSFVDKT